MVSIDYIVFYMQTAIIMTDWAVHYTVIIVIQDLIENRDRIVILSCDLRCRI